MTADYNPAELNHSGPSVNKRDDAFPFSDQLLQQIHRVIGEGESTHIESITSLSGYSNNMVRLNLSDGRALMVKCAQYDWAGPRFQSSRRASELLQQETSVITPEHVPIDGRVENKPVLAYWYIPLTPLEDVWADLTFKKKVRGIRSLGKLLREVHRVKVDRLGSLSQKEPSFDSINSYMESDLLERLKPAVWAKWYDAVPVLDQLAQMASGLPQEDDTVLVHNDMHLGNVLCEQNGDELKCVGLLDLEAAEGGNRVSDIASTTIMYNPLFFGKETEWLEDFDHYLQEGYGEQVDPFLLHFFQTYHLLNLGFFSILNDDRLHARQTLELAQETLHKI